MPRQPRVVAVGAPHHITQRGNNRIPVFRSDADRLFYLDTLRRKARDHGLAVLGWCLMPNHVHLVAVPSRADSLARALGETHRLHAQRFNRLYRRSGHLWQNRFYSCPLGDAHLLEALAYVDLNPVRARLADRAEAYRWSSAAAHIVHADPHELLDDWIWSDIDRGHDWRDLLASRPLSATAARALRYATRHGRPLGDDLAVAKAVAHSAS